MVLSGSSFANRFSCIGCWSRICENVSKWFCGVKLMLPNGCPCINDEEADSCMCAGATETERQRKGENVSTGYGFDKLRGRRTGCAVGMHSNCQYTHSYVYRFKCVSHRCRRLIRIALISTCVRRCVMVCFT